MKSLDEGGARRASQQLLTPPPSLAGVVESMWFDEWRGGRDNGQPFRVVADGAPHIIWNLYTRPRRVEVLNVVGARRTHCDLDVSGRAFTFGIQLKPGAIPALFARPAHALTDRSVPLATIIGGKQDDLRRMRLSSPDRGLQRMESLLERLVEASNPIDWRAGWIQTLDPRDASATTAAMTFRMCDRALRAWSVRSLGMGLKRFLRIRRLHLALEMRISGDEPHWSRAAAAAGYADHAHLVRDCRALLGESPSAYVGRADLFKREALARR